MGCRVRDHQTRPRCGDRVVLRADGSLIVKLVGPQRDLRAVSSG